MTSETIMMKVKQENFSKQSFWKRNGINLLYSLIIALFIVLVCTLSDKSFFFYDDAQNDGLAYLRKIGRLWLNGEIPFIIKDSMIGQNQMIDIYRGIFLPENILFSILSVKLNSFILISDIIAFIRISMMSFFSFKIGESLSINRKFRIILSFLFCINPIFLYFYLPSWWGIPGGQIWFIASLASILLLRKSFKLKYLIFNIFSTLFLLVSAWPQSIIAYIFVVIYFLLELLKNKEYNKIIVIILIYFGVILISLNIYSEYIISSYLLDRDSGFGNFGNFLNPSFNQIFMTFTPVYYNFMNRFGGYLITYVPIGYSSIYILYLLCFSKRTGELFKDKNFNFLFYLSLIFFILAQLPSQFSQIRFQFRFLPYLSELLVILSIYGIGIKKLEFSKSKIKIFVGFIMLSSLLSIFSVEGDFKKIFQVNCIFIILSVSYLYTVIKGKEFNFIYSIGYNIFMFLLMIFVQSSINGILPFPGIKEHINMENNFSKKGYLLSLTNGNQSRKNLEDLFTGEFLYYGVKSINGYSPIGNKEINKLLGYPRDAQHIMDKERAVNSLSNKYREVCYFDLLNITSIAMLKEDLNNNDIKSRIENCKFHLKNVKNPSVVYFVKNHDIVGNISYVSEGIKVNKILENKANKEKYEISTNKKGYVILSKVYWRGYRAFVDGKKVNISDENGLIKVDDIPLGLNNAVLEIKYFPASWRVTLWLGLIGIVVIVLTLKYLKKREDEIVEKTNNGNI